VARGKLFGERSVGTVALVEAPVSMSYARRARLVFVLVSLSVWVLSATALSTVRHLLSAIAIGLVVGVAAGFVAAVVVRVWPVLRAIWWWLAEVTAALALLESTAWLARATEPWIALTAFTVLVIVVVAVGPVRRFVVAWGWCAVVRHRLRLVFAEVIRSANRVRPASLPLILIARPTPAGERVWLWLRPGLDLAELEGRTGKIAVTCWASEARIVRASTRYAALLRVDISRRDPLTDMVASPLAGLLAGWADSPAPVSPGMPPLGLDLADIPEEPPEPPTRGPRR
jgi:hypothetical protein